MTSEVSRLLGRERRESPAGGFSPRAITESGADRRVGECAGESYTIEVMAWMKSKLVRITTAVGGLATLIVAGSATFKIG